MLGRDQSYSTLEAASSLPPIQTIRANQPFPIDLGKQVAPDNGKQVTPDNGKQFAADRTGLEVTINNDSWTNHVEIIDDRVVQRHRSLRKWKAIAGAIIVMIVLAVVFGVIFGSRHTNSSTRAPVQLSDSSTTAPSATSNQATALPTLLPRRNIAAVSFESNSVNNTHIYFLDNHGRVIQAAQTTKNTTWVLRIIGTGAKKGSALAAAVSRRYFTLAIRVLYLDENDLLYDINFTPSSGNWTFGTLSNQGYTAMPNSSLTVMYNQCKLCANTTIIAFQDKNGFIQIGNLTTHGWVLTQLGPDLEPEMGTALALAPFYSKGEMDQLNLYYQKSYLVMNLASWKPYKGTWTLNEKVYRTIPFGSPIAAATSWSRASTGFATWIEVLFLSAKGVQVKTWLAGDNQQYTSPSVMANSTSNQKSYGALSVTALGRAFAVASQKGQVDAIESWKVEENALDWKSTGGIVLDGIWD